MSNLLTKLKKNKLIQQSVKRFIVRYRLVQKSNQDRANGREVIHFLHIGKTGGTAVKHALSSHLVENQRVIYLHDHHVTIDLLPKKDRFFFFLREPISRFVSGFYSRKRQGLPRYHFPWNKEEKEAFSYFETPEVLACSLSSDDCALKRRSIAAMRGIQHIRDTYESLNITCENLDKKRKQILFIGFQESLNTDFQKLSTLLEISAKLPDDTKHAHRGVGEMDKNLSHTAINNLTRWFEEDLQTYNHCKNMEFPVSCGLKHNHC